MNDKLMISVFLMSLAVARVGWAAAPAAPDSVWTEDSGVPGFVVVVWPSVPNADGYRIYLELAVTTDANPEGEIVQLESPEYALIQWGYVEQQEGVIRAVVANFGTAASLGVATVQGGQESSTTWYGGADFNLDGRVDLDDFFLFADAFGTDRQPFDLNRDLKVDLADFSLFADAFGRKQR